MNSGQVTGQAIARASIALVWVYQGFWCKVLGRMPHHLSIVSAVPFIGSGFGRAVLMLLGVVECAIGVWVMTGRRMRMAAMVQTVLLLTMNAGGMIWAWRLLPDPFGMILQNFAFVVLIWTTAEARHDLANA